jgi:hypothetical protein
VSSNRDRGRGDDDIVKKMWSAIGPEFERLYCQTKRKSQITISLV